MWAQRFSQGPRNGQWCCEAPSSLEILYGPGRCPDLWQQGCNPKSISFVFLLTLPLWKPPVTLASLTHDSHDGYSSVSLSSGWFWCRTWQYPCSLSALVWNVYPSPGFWGITGTNSSKPNKETAPLATIASFFFGLLQFLLWKASPFSRTVGERQKHVFDMQRL